MEGTKGKLVIIFIVLVIIVVSVVTFTKLSSGVDNRSSFEEYDKYNTKYISEDLVSENTVAVGVVGIDMQPIWNTTSYKEGETAFQLIKRLNEENPEFRLQYFGGANSTVISSISSITPDRTKYMWKFYVNGKTVDEGLSYKVAKADIIIFAVEEI